MKPKRKHGFFSVIKKAKVQVPFKPCSIKRQRKKAKEGLLLTAVVCKIKNACFHWLLLH